MRHSARYDCSQTPLQGRAAHLPLKTPGAPVRKRAHATRVFAVSYDMPQGSSAHHHHAASSTPQQASCPPTPCQPMLAPAHSPISVMEHNDTKTRAPRRIRSLLDEAWEADPSLHCDAPTADRPQTPELEWGDDVFSIS